MKVPATAQARQRILEPVFRKLRVFALDPGLTARFETAVINEMTLNIPWEDLEPGPSGEYLAVVDVDEHGTQLYDPVDLNRAELLASDGKSPSDGDPQFHQQMVYAVATRTIRIFERALGRPIHWAQRQVKGEPRKVHYERQLKLHPHFKQEPNAYYSTDNASVRFGHFIGRPQTPFEGTQVYSCLSQDVVTHEMMHAVLWGMNYRFRTAWFDLKWLPSVRAGSAIPRTGKNLIVVARVNKLLRFRIFDSDGKVAVNTDERRLKKQAPAIAELKRRLARLKQAPNPTDSETGAILQMVTSIVGYKVHVRVNLDEFAFHEAFADLVALLLHFWDSDVLRALIATARGRLDEPGPLGAVALQFGQALGHPDGLRNAFGKTFNGTWTPRVPDPQAARTEQEPHARGDLLVAAVFEAFRKMYESQVADLRRIASRGTGELPAGSLHPDLVNRLAREVSRLAAVVLDMCIRALDFMPPVGVTFGDFLRAVITADHDVNPEDPGCHRQAFVQAFREYGICPQDVGTVSARTLIWPGPENAEVAHALVPFVHKLSKRLAYWNLPPERSELWYVLEETKIELHRYLSDLKTPQRLGVIDFRKPFEVQAVHPRQRAGEPGTLQSQWVIKLLQPPTPPNQSPGLNQIGCTLLVEADSGLVRYQIDKQRPAPPEDRKNPGLARALSAPSGGAAAVLDERRLRTFAFDPTMGIASETAVINEVVLRVPWERDSSGGDALGPGPVGEYLEVVDRDPASSAFYAPIDLNDPRLLAQQGLAPSESNPQFHQQMVYAVAMRTIRTFERALGRLALWSPRREVSHDGPGDRWTEEYVQRLRIYPHALREANAYYSPAKKALLFGYFPDPGFPGRPRDGSMIVFTCLSHDIIAHETTHALLDGMHRRFNEPSNPDVLAFHEAFADIVALFQHFSLPDVLRHQVAQTRGDLESQNRLGELAQQFGQATGNRGALRSALGTTDPITGEWQRARPDPDAYRRLKEPHARGALLVAAVFDAFLTIYKAAVADLLRIASEGTGVLPAGHLHPDLVNRLSDEAARSAAHVLSMCIRALDYCPPVDLTFGDYLRAIVTADYEFDPVDEKRCRVAFAEAFRRHGIVPEDVRTLSVDGLLWRTSADAPEEDEDAVLSEVRKWAPDIASWSLTRSREKLYDLMKKKRAALHSYLKARLKKHGSGLAGINFDLPVEVHSVRPSFRTDWKGRPRFQWVIELTQRDGKSTDPEGGLDPDGDSEYWFRGGSTLVVDAETGKVRYSIRKKLDDDRRQRQRQYLMEDGNESLAATYFGGVGRAGSEPFAMLHRL
jgi:hypothetical protein